MTYRAEDWKAGDVAMIPFTRGGVRAMYTGEGWVTCDRTPVRAVADYINMRRLVVIDPVSITGPDETGDDGDPLAEIANCLRRLAEGHYSSYRRRVAERLAEAFDPTPPKPDEPLGLGAVVEDADGARWVRTAWTGDGGPWESRAGHAGLYADITAVKVLSEGVPSE